jgi:hypothetical protein
MGIAIAATLGPKSTKRAIYALPKTAKRSIYALFEKTGRRLNPAFNQCGESWAENRPKIHRRSTEDCPGIYIKY